VASAAEQPIFYYDLGSPECYLAAERIMAALPVVPEWEPVMLDSGAAMPDAGEATPAPGEATPDPGEATPDAGEATLDAGEAFADRQSVGQRALELGLQPLRWPARWPPDSRRAMLAATYAKQIGRAVAFSLAAFRQEFAGGRDLGDENTVLIAAAACEMHPTAVLKGIALRSVTAALDEAGSRARAAGVQALPAVQVHGRVFEGEKCVEDAAAALGAAV
jgi:2-hydroxychromene-2-carboxylate isomerase